MLSLAAPLANKGAVWRVDAQPLSPSPSRRRNARRSSPGSEPRSSLLGCPEKPRQDFLDVFAELARLSFGHLSTQVWLGSAVQSQQIQCTVLYESHRSSESTSLRICVQHALTRFVSRRARMILLLAEGRSITAIAATVG